MSFRPNGIAIHHSAGQDTDEENRVGIKRYHSKKWNTDHAGYHWIIERVGEYFDRFNSRPENMKGIHVKGKNSNYIGFCFVGDYSEQSPPKIQVKTGSREIARCMFRNKIPFSNVRPHSDITEPGHTDCPGDKFPVNQVRSYARRHYIRCLDDLDAWPIHAQQQAMRFISIDAGPVDGLNGDKTQSGRVKAYEKFGLESKESWSDRLQSRLLRKLKRDFVIPGQDYSN